MLEWNFSPFPLEKTPLSKEYKNTRTKESVWQIIMKKTPEEAAQVCTAYKWVVGETISASGDTVLHKIVANRKVELVEQLVQKDIVNLENLKKTNIRGNNALHVAAAVGNVKMCQLFTDKDSGLMNSRNNEGETPLFLAVLYDSKEAFLYLHERMDKESDECSCLLRRKNGDTILHCAITCDYFELALEILQLHEELASGINEDGFSALHLLAKKGNAFKSQSHHGWNSRIIYNCIRVEVPRQVTYWIVEESQDNRRKGLFWMLKNTMYSTGTSWGRRQERAPDIENPREPHVSSEGSKSNKEDSQGFSSIYAFVNDKLFGGIRKIKEEKVKHIYAAEVLEQLAILSASAWNDESGGPPGAVEPEPGEGGSMESELPKLVITKENGKNVKKTRTKKSPILLAAQNGSKEVLEKILKYFPSAINDVDSKGNNVVLLAARNRQIEVYKFLVDKFDKDEFIFHKVNNKGNTALHRAAMLTRYSDELNPTSTSIMRWEIKWFEYIKKNMAPYLILHLNRHGRTATEVFTDKHRSLIKEASEEVKKMAEACSVVATLVATVAFATSVTVPGGPDKDGTPVLEHQSGFIVFAISSLLSLTFSMTSLLTFLSILNTRPSERDFGEILPRKILLGMISLLVSLATIVVSYCSSHFFLLKDELKIDARPIYATIGVGITIFTGFQFIKSFDFFKYPLPRVPKSKK